MTKNFLQKKLDEIAKFCCELENEAYDRGMEDMINPITDKILNIINKGE
jgi:hypothetical protein